MPEQRRSGNSVSATADQVQSAGGPYAESQSSRCPPAVLQQFSGIHALVSSPAFPYTVSCREQLHNEVRLFRQYVQRDWSSAIEADVAARLDRLRQTLLQDLLQGSTDALIYMRLVRVATGYDADRQQLSTPSAAPVTLFGFRVYIDDTMSDQFPVFSTVDMTAVMSAGVYETIRDAIANEEPTDVGQARTESSQRLVESIGRILRRQRGGDGVHAAEPSTRQFRPMRLGEAEHDQDTSGDG